MSPRLAPGEIAPGIMKKKEKNQRSINALVSALRKALEGSEQIDTSILEAARTQTGIQKFELPEKFIYSMSTNAFKENCKYLLPGGFNEFKDLRVNAYNAYLQSTRKAPGPNTKLALSEQNQTLKEENNAFRDSIVEFSYMYMDLFMSVRDLSRNYPPLKQKFEEHLVRFSSPRNKLRLVTNNDGTDAGIL